MIPAHRLLAALLLPLLVAAAPPGDGASRAEVEAYIRRAAAGWAAGDPVVMREILAEDYAGVGSTGEVRSKAKQLELAAGPSPYAKTKVDYIDFRHFGDTIIAQGAETLGRADGGPDRRLIWTDIWMKRGGRWQVVASQDSVRPPEPSPEAEAVRARRAAYVAAMQARRADLIGDFLAPEMVQLASSGAMEVGRDAVVKSYAETEFKDPAFLVYERVPDTIEISENGRFAVERGHWRALSRRDGKIVTGNSGLYQAGWIKRDGVWRVRTESYTRLRCASEDDCPR
jgi:ketosteroid isomerase-like protein